MTRYLTVEDILAIHAAQLELFGGGEGVRDMGLVEAALFRPQTGYYADVIEEAAALWESFLMNHPFVDGNKRTAFEAMHVFLLINGFDISLGPQAVGDLIYDLFDRKAVTFKNLDGFLRENIRAFEL